MKKEILLSVREIILPWVGLAIIGLAVIWISITWSKSIDDTKLERAEDVCESIFLYFKIDDDITICIDMVRDELG